MKRTAKKRGRPAQPPDRKKTYKVSIRLTPGLALKVQSLAAVHGATITAEIERIVEQFFEIEPKQRDLFGGPKTYSLSLLIGLALRSLRIRTGHWWHEDTF